MWNYCECEWKEYFDITESYGYIKDTIIIAFSWFDMEYGWPFYVINN